jgi:hypothetical protein
MPVTRKVEIASEGEVCVSKAILIKKLEQMFQNLENVKQQIMDLDPNVGKKYASSPNPRRRN